MRYVRILTFVIGFLTTNIVAAQTMQFEFTARKEFGFGMVDFGESLSGVITVDYQTAPDLIEPGTSCGEVATWFSGLFTVDVMTSTGEVAGTTFDGGSLTARSRDEPCGIATSVHSIENVAQDAGQTIVVRFETVDRRQAGDGIADWSDFDPTGDPTSEDERSIVFISFSDFTAGIFGSGFYRVDSVTPIVTNIVVDGIDTGIADFEFEGALVSSLIQEFADTAKNHGQFVSSVAKLSNQLKKADLITKDERNLLVDIAAKSSIGKK